MTAFATPRFASRQARGWTPGARVPGEYYPTPDSAVSALLVVETFDGSIWEPACGTGHISRIFEADGYEVVSTDLHDRGYGT